MEFNLVSLEGNLKKMTELFLCGQGHRCGECGVIIEYKRTADGRLRIEYDGERVILSGQHEPHYYRALHLFLQEMRSRGEGLNLQEMKPGSGGTFLQEVKSREKEPFFLEEKSRFLEAGLMLDCSRNGTLRLPMLKEMIRISAVLGLGQLYIYMEDVYEIPEDPYFGAFRGKYTFEELKELDSYGLSMGVELIPAIQTLAHLHTYLRWPKTKDLRDTSDILLVGAEETKRFVRLMIHNAVLPFSSKRIHVGMDEADLLGLGKYMRIHGYTERYRIMTEHLNMVHKVCKEEGLEAMIWSDMFFRLKSPTGDYYDIPEEAEFHLPQPIPEDLTLVYWDYYHHERSEYTKNMRLHYKLTDNLCFAGGGWTWNGISPNLRKAQKTLKEGLAACEEQGIKRTFCTFWFDNGMETPARTAIYGAVYYAQLCYHEEAKAGSIDSWLKQLTGYGKEDFLLLDLFDSPEGVLGDNSSADNPSKYLLYQDPLTGLFDGQVAQMDLGPYYRRLGAELGKLQPKGNRMDGIFYYYRILAEVLAQKAMLGVRLRNSYQKGDRSELALLKDCMSVCAGKVWELKEARKKIWFEECSPFGYEVLDIRYGGVKTRLESAVQRVEAYLNGDIGRLEELEEKMLIYEEDTKNVGHKFCAEGDWRNIVSGGNISGI